MSDQIRMSMLNKRGRVLWINASQVNELKELGWKVIQNPQQDYYPQYDQAYQHDKDDSLNMADRVVTGVDADVIKLGIVQV